MMEWQPIDSAPKDGSWFLICRQDEGFESYEIGRYEPYFFDRFIEDGSGLYRRVPEMIGEWNGFNNFHRATHWMPAKEPPK